MSIDDIKNFIIENRKGLIVGAAVALVLRSLLR